MTWRRFFWRCVTPIVWLSNRAGACSYEWVNVCHGAWHPNRFSRLWQFERYGSPPLLGLPENIVLCGIAYSVQASEGIVTFRSDPYFASRITFERDDHNLLADLWYIEVRGHVPAAHVDDAYRWVRAAFGGSFVRKRPVTILQAAGGIDA